MSAEEVRRRSFATSFRGFDQSEVRSFLDRMADELAAAEAAERQLREELRQARDRLLHPRLDEDTLTSALGEEAAKILRSAHEAAADVRGRAEENAARMLAEAHAEAQRIRATAETVLAERTAEAEAEVSALRRAAEVSVAEMVSRAQGQAETALAEVRSASDAMAEEADQLKVQVLGDLAQRRRIMNAQVEQLAAGRDSILRAVHTVRGFLDEIVGTLDSAEGDAKRAAAEALQRALARSEADMEELEREIGPSLAAPMALLAEVSSDLTRSLEALEQKTPPRLTSVPDAPDLPPPPVEPSAPIVEEVRSSGDQPAASATADPVTVEVAPVVSAEPAPTAPIPPVEPAPSEPAPSEPAEGEAAPTPSYPSPNTPRRRLERLALIRRPQAESEHEPLESVRIIRPQPVVEEPPPPPAAEEPTVVLSVVPEPAVDEPAEEATAEVPATQAAEAATAAEPEVDSAESTAKVDELFARLRAEREKSRAEAEAVLAAVEEPAVAEAPAAPDDAAVAEEAPAADIAVESEAPGAPVEDEAEPEPIDEDAAVGGLLEARNQALAPVHERLARRLKRTLQDDQNALLDRVRGDGRGKQASLPDAGEHETVYANAVGALIEEAYGAGADFAVQHFGGTRSGSVNGSASAPFSSGLATDLVRQLRGRLEPAFTTAPDDVEMTETINAAYRTWKGERVEAFAMDYAVGAFAAGVISGVTPGTVLRWIVDDDGGPCPDCDDNGLADTAAGQPFPTGQPHPPAHPGCRCLLVPASA